MSVTANNGKPRRAIIYTRVSTGGQEMNTSLAGQAVACHRKAEEIGAQVVNLYEETKSGGLYLSRPGIQKSLEEIEAGNADTLIVYKLDRSGRVVDDLRDIRRRILKTGGEFVFADGMQFENTPTGNLMFTQIGAFAEFERETIRERCVKGLRARAANGEQVAVNRPPYGYHIATRADIIRGDYKSEDKGKYFILEDQAQTIRRIFQWKADCVSVRSIQKKLALSGIPSPTGRKLWAQSSLRHILENETYKGEGGYGRTMSRVDESRVASGLRARHQSARNKGEAILFDVPAIVTPALWNAAYKALKEGREKHSGRKDRRYMLSGLLYCPHCDAKLVTRARINPSSKPDEPARLQYSCRFSLPNNVKQCPARSYNSVPIERATVAAILYLIEHPKALEVSRKACIEKMNDKPKPDNTAGRLKALKAKLTKLDASERIAAQSKVEARLSGASVAVWDEMLSRYQEERTLLESERAEIESILAPVKLPLADWENIAFKPDEMKDFRMVLSDERPINAVLRHELLSRIVDRIYPIEKGHKSLGARVILKSAPGVEYSIVSQKDMISTESKQL